MGAILFLLVIYEKQQSELRRHFEIPAKFRSHSFDPYRESQFQNRESSAPYMFI
jgi:hypothetical protein